MKIDGRKLSHAQLEAIRFQAVKAVQAGQPPTAVARALGLYPARVFVWLAAYRAGGWDALRARKASGRPKRLTGSQLRWIYNTVTSKNPLQLQFPFALWTRAMIGTLIRRQYGIKLSAISVGRLLAQMGLSCQKPLSRAFEQDATLVKQWIERDFPKIRALAKKERAVVFFADESGVRSDFHAGTTWGIRGKTPVVRHTGKRFIAAQKVPEYFGNLLGPGFIQGDVSPEFIGGSHEAEATRGNVGRWAFVETYVERADSRRFWRRWSLWCHQCFRCSSL